VKLLFMPYAMDAIAGEAGDRGGQPIACTGTDDQRDGPTSWEAGGDRRNLTAQVHHATYAAIRVAVQQQESASGWTDLACGHLYLSREVGWSAVCCSMRISCCHARLRKRDVEWSPCVDMELISYRTDKGPSDSHQNTDTE
jgi:tRNA(Arg) A34 adenosine deaminase TadA